MGGMMGTAGTSEVWIILWIILGAVLLAAGIMVALVLTTRHRAERALVSGAELPGVRDAQAALRLRYANGDISREEYLQGKVELED
jgi:uncharacterized membrane protein